MLFTSVHGRVESFHPPTQHLGSLRDVGDITVRIREYSCKPYLMWEGVNSPDRDTSIPDFFSRSSRSQHSHTGLTQALGELEEIRLVVHRQKGFDPDLRRVFVGVSGLYSPMGVDIAFSSPESNDERSGRGTNRASPSATGPEPHRAESDPVSAPPQQSHLQPHLSAIQSPELGLTPRVRPTYKGLLNRNICRSTGSAGTGGCNEGQGSMIRYGTPGSPPCL